MAMSTGLGANQLYAIKMLEQHGSLTASQLAKFLGMESVYNASKTMRGLRDRRLAYISSWVNGNHAVWSLGDKPDVKRDPISPREANRKYKQRTKKRIGSKLMRMIQNAQNDKKTSAIVIDGVKIWERGRGILV